MFGVLARSVAEGRGSTAEMVEAGEQPKKWSKRESSRSGRRGENRVTMGSTQQCLILVEWFVQRVALKFIALDDPTRAKTKGFATACGLTGRRVSKEQQRGEDLHSWGSGKAEPAVVLPTLPKRHNIKTCSREGSVSPRRLGELLTSVQQGDVNGSAELGGSPPACLVTYHRR